MQRPKGMPTDRDVPYHLVVSGHDAEGTWCVNDFDEQVPADAASTKHDVAMNSEQTYVAVLPWHAQRAAGDRASGHLTPVPAGYLVPTLRPAVPDSLGTVELTLSDGGLLPRTEVHDQDLPPEERVEPDFVGAALRQPVSEDPLGPLPAGTYQFDVWLGGVRVRQVTATVVAGKIQPLVISATK